VVGRIEGEWRDDMPITDSCCGRHDGLTGVRLDCRLFAGTDMGIHINLAQQIVAQPQGFVELQVVLVEE
jgi:hypothetical protein